jgi:hypothetical protein
MSSLERLSRRLGPEIVDRIDPDEGRTLGRLGFPGGVN